VVVILYVAGLSEAIRRAGDEVGIKTVFSASDTLKKRLSHVQPKQNGLEKEVIYKIPVNVEPTILGKQGVHWRHELTNTKGTG
jgi:hypothetical protein